MSTSDYTDNTPNPEDTAPVILSPITQALNDNKITLDRIASKFSELIDCKRTYVTKDGIEIDTPDRPTQLKATIESGKLLQAYPAERKELEITMPDTSDKLKKRIQDNIQAPEKLLGAVKEDGE